MIVRGDRVQAALQDLGVTLAAGLVDEMEINIVPTLLGSGERLFEGGVKMWTPSTPSASRGGSR